MAFLPEITALYAAALALMLVGLSIYVILARLKYKISIGNGTEEELLRRNRMQGNFVEYVPMILILMLIMELNGLQPFFLHAMGLVTLISRGLHAYALSDKNSPLIFRQIGMIGTFLVLIGGAILSVWPLIF